MTNHKRRSLLKGTLTGGALILAAGAGLLKPLKALAAEWPKSAFNAKTVPEALKNLYGGATAATSKDITIKAPIQAENGAVVPISISTSLPHPESISIVVEKNPNPLIANVALTPGAEGFFSARIKMGKTSNVNVYVKSQGKIYMASQQIKVTVGGCGG